MSFDLLSLFSLFFALLLFFFVFQTLEFRRRDREKSETIESKECALLEKEEKIQELLHELGQARQKYVEKEVELRELHFRHAGSEEKLKEVFKNLSTDALNQNINTFLELATVRFENLQQAAKQELTDRHSAFNVLIQPIQTCLNSVDQKLSDLEKTRLSSQVALGEQIQRLHQSHAGLQIETSNLVKALRTPHVRGRWGEVQLKRVIEIAGMLEHCDFLEQESVTVDAKKYRPDIIVKLPGGKQVVIDAKAPLQAYLESLDSQDEREKKIKLKEHSKQIRTHVQQLSSKSYWEQFTLVPEFVVLFVPGEMFFSAALENDPSLIEWAIDQKIVLATPTTLIALLRSIAFGWRQEAIAENAQKISELGRLLYERIRILTEHFDEIKKGLDKSVSAYNRAVGSFESRVLTSARRFKELGATTQEDILVLEKVDQALREVTTE